MANISAFSKSIPSGTSRIRDGDDIIRSDKSILQAALNEEHYFDPQNSASSASGGIHRKGSARIYTGTRSQVSGGSADADGRLMWATDTESLHLLTSSSASTAHWGKFPPGIVIRPTGVQTESANSALFFNGSATYQSPGNSFYTSGGNTSVFTIPSNHSGLYEINAHFTWTDQTPGVLLGLILVNGVEHLRISNISSGQAYPLGIRTAQGRTVWPLNSGDTVQFVIGNSGGGTPSGLSVNGTCITIRRL